MAVLKKGEQEISSLIISCDVNLTFLWHFFFHYIVFFFFFNKSFGIISVYVYTYNFYHDIFLQNWLIIVLENSLGWKWPRKTIWSNLSWEGEPRWDYLAPCPMASWKPPVLWTMSLGRLFQWMTDLTVHFFVFSYRGETSPAVTCNHCPLSSPCGSLWRESLHPLCSCPLSTEILWWGPP